MLVFEISPSNKATSEPKDVDQIDDYEDMIRLMTSLKLSTSRFQSLDKMKLRVKEKLTSSSWTIGKDVRIFYVVQPEVITE